MQGLSVAASVLQDLAKDSAQHYKPARKLFDALALQMSAQAHAMDVFACSLDQVSCNLYILKSIHRRCLPKRMGWTFVHVRSMRWWVCASSARAAGWHFSPPISDC